MPIPETLLKPIGEYSRPTLNKATNPTLIAAQILMERGLPISISEGARTIRGRELPGFVQIVATGDGRVALNTVFSTPEYQVLEDAALGANGLFGVTRPNLSDCPWDQDTKRRVPAFHWENRAVWFQNDLDRERAGNPIDRWSRPSSAADLSELERQIREVRDRAERLLINPEPLIALTAGDIRFLLEEAVNRVLAQGPQSK